MAQLRHDYKQFIDRNTEIVVVGPNRVEEFKQYWEEHSLPLIGLPDPSHKILKLYGQQVKLFKFGRMPAQAIIDRNRIVRYVHYGISMSDIPPNEELLTLIDQINHR
jgi:peroxiredoxin